MFKNISVNDLEKIDDGIIIDIRSNNKYRDGNIFNSINIPCDQLLINYSKYLKKDNKYYIYCQKGFRSKQLCRFLFNKGYNVINVIGGYETWILKK